VTQDNVDHALDSLARYRACVADAEAVAATRRGDMPEHAFKRELKLAREMIALLPTKIHHVQTKGGTIDLPW